MGKKKKRHPRSDTMNILFQWKPLFTIHFQYPSKVIILRCFTQEYISDVHCTIIPLLFIEYTSITKCDMIPKCRRNFSDVHVFSSPDPPLWVGELEGWKKSEAQVTSIPPFFKPSTGWKCRKKNEYTGGEMSIFHSIRHAHTTPLSLKRRSNVFWERDHPRDGTHEKIKGKHIQESL